MEAAAKTFFTSKYYAVAGMLVVSLNNISKLTPRIQAQVNPPINSATKAIGPHQRSSSADPDNLPQYYTGTTNTLSRLSLSHPPVQASP